MITAGVGGDQWSPGEVDLSPCLSQKLMDPDLRWVRWEGESFSGGRCYAPTISCVRVLARLMGGFHVSIIPTVLRQSV